MTILAGVFVRRGDGQLPKGAREGIRGLLSRDPRDEVLEFADGRIYLGKVDIGAFDGSGFLRARDGTVSMIAGDPLLPEGRGRQADLETLHANWLANNWDDAARTRGQYCAVFYCPRQSKLSVTTDRLGLRGLYLYVSEDIVAFASALRILEGLSFVPKTIDVVGVAERCAYGVPLGDRSLYREIKLLRGAEVCEFDKGAERRFYYWRWPVSDGSPMDQASICDRLSEAFQAAISLRLKNDRTALAFLSGGLDSRCVVGALRARDVTVYSLNFAGPSTQDRVFGEQVAKALGTFHTSVTLGSEQFRVQAALEAWRRSLQDEAVRPDRPLVVWGGEGGSAGLGHIYLNEAIVAAGRARDWQALHDEFAAYNRWSAKLGRVLREPVLRRVDASVKSDFRAEVERLFSINPERAPYLFILENDQRRHLEPHFSNADLYRAEILNPFYDVEFLSEVIRSPIDPFLRHKLYVEWLKRFPSAVHEVPWQAYPGHVGPSTQVPLNLEYQWSAGRISPQSRRLAATVLRQCLSRGSFPSPILNRSIVVLAAALTATGLLDRGHVVATARRYMDAWKNSSKYYSAEFV